MEDQPCVVALHGLFLEELVEACRERDPSLDLRTWDGQGEVHERVEGRRGLDEPSSASHGPSSREMKQERLTA